jgi:ADP-ribose pyrophosphatase YjhB (NUDIX family)
LIFDRGRILMAQRGKEPLKGWWSLPGGALETGESLDSAVRAKSWKRRALVEPAGVFEIFERIIRDADGAAEYHYVLIDYVCRVTGGSLRGRRRVQRGVDAARRAEGPANHRGTLGVIERAFRKRRQSKKTARENQR